MKLLLKIGRAVIFTVLGLFSSMHAMEKVSVPTHESQLNALQECIGSIILKDVSVAERIRMLFILEFMQLDPKEIKLNEQLMQAAQKRLNHFKLLKRVALDVVSAQEKEESSISSQGLSSSGNETDFLSCMVHVFRIIVLSLTSAEVKILERMEQADQMKEGTTL